VVVAVVVIILVDQEELVELVVEELALELVLVQAQELQEELTQVVAVVVLVQVDQHQKVLQVDQVFLQ
jgi:hypothetical protein|tara:strand:+ start:445 stop:648 length:204 start_codon:yes stop_codon:yes gene_type:complete